METMQITSDVRQKLNKIRSGDVFDSPLVFVTEMLQNSYRAGAKTVNINIGNNTFVIVDDGCGCRNPKPVLTLDYSEWTSTDEGFGIGFWSILAIPELTEVIVSSKNWSAQIDVEKMFTSGIPEATVTQNEKNVGGFAVGLESRFFGENAYAIREEIRTVGELQPFDIYVNGVPVAKKNLLNDVSGAWTKTFVNARFAAKLAVAPKTWESPELYYERRYVTSLPDIHGVTGIIELNQKVLKLKEPDRKSVIKDDRYLRFKSTMRRCVEELYLDFLQGATPEKIDEYAQSIDSVLTVDQYERFVTIEAEPKTEEKTVEMVDSDESYDDEEVETNPITREMFAQASASITSNVVIPKVKEHAQKNATLAKDAIKAQKKRVWVKASELDDMSELKSKAEYYGITVFVANNILQEKVYKKHGVPHLSELKNGVTKTNIIANGYVKTAKEEAFLRLMTPIVKHYKLSLNAITIADLKMVVETRLDGKLVDKETVKVGGICYDKQVTLDRKTLGLKRFHLYNRGNGVGQHELKAIMANLTLIAHELAHLLYGTTDNTAMQWKAEEQIRKEIVGIFLNL
jgi:hypothetical protein